MVVVVDIHSCGARIGAYPSAVGAVVTLEFIIAASLTVWAILFIGENHGA
jgi:hypothetical protein